MALNKIPTPFIHTIFKSETNKVDNTGFQIFTISINIFLEYSYVNIKVSVFDIC